MSDNGLSASLALFDIPNRIDIPPLMLEALQAREEYVPGLEHTPAGRALLLEIDAMLNDPANWPASGGLPSFIQDHRDAKAAAADAKKAEEVARREEQEAKRIADGIAWRAQRAIEAEAEKAEADRIARIEWNAKLAAKKAREAEEATLQEREDAARLAARTQDDDVHVLEVTVAFQILGTLQGDASPPKGEDDPTAWYLDDDDEECERLVHQVQGQIAEALAPWTAHYKSIGMLRADGLRPIITNGFSEGDGNPAFYLVYRADDAGCLPESLGAFETASLPLEAIPGATIVVEASTRPVNATLFFEALKLRAERGHGLVGLWGGEDTPEMLPDQEDRDEWLDRVAAPAERIIRLVERWETSGANPRLFAMYGAPYERPGGGKAIGWVGMFARGCVSSLVGTNGSGKSTAIHAYVAAAAGVGLDGPREVWGTQLTGRFVAALVAGEDDESMIDSRAAYFEKAWGRACYYVLDGIANSLDQILADLANAPVLDLVVFDPARKFLEGNEDSSEVVSQFYDRLTALARQKNCAVVVVHHLSKGQPRGIRQMLQAVRGSGVHTDRARMVIGMASRASDTVEIAVIKSNFPPSEPTWGPLNEGRLFRRDAETLMLVPVGGAAEARAGGDEPDAVTGRILAAIERQAAAGIIVRRTGKAGLFALKLPELNGVSRAIIHDELTALIAAARIADGETGLQIVLPSRAPGSGG